MTEEISITTSVDDVRENADELSKTLERMGFEPYTDSDGDRGYYKGSTILRMTVVEVKQVDGLGPPMGFLSVSAPLPTCQFVAIKIEEIQKAVASILSDPKGATVQ